MPVADGPPPLSLLSATQTAPIGVSAPPNHSLSLTPARTCLDPTQTRFWPIAAGAELDYTAARMLLAPASTPHSPRSIPTHRLLDSHNPDRVRDRDVEAKVRRHKRRKHSPRHHVIKT